MYARRIIELLKQLFWKQNQYAAKNNTYGHKGVHDRDESRDKSTPITQTARTELTEGNKLGTIAPSVSDTRISYQDRSVKFWEFQSMHTDTYSVRFRGRVASAPDQSLFSESEQTDLFMTSVNGNGTDFNATHGQDKIRQTVEKHKDIFEVSDDVFHHNSISYLGLRTQTNAR